MIRLNVKQKISIQIVVITIYLILIIPLINNETIINIILPDSIVLSSIVVFLFLVFAVYAFIELRKQLKKMNSNWRYLLYVIIGVWLMTNVKSRIGETVMTYRSGLNAIEFLADNSEIAYQKDTLGTLHCKGQILFRNYSSDTVAFQGILYGNNFMLEMADKVADIDLPDETIAPKDTKITVPPMSTYAYPVEFKTELEVNTMIYSVYNGKINRIRKFTIFDDKAIKTF